MKNRTLFLSFIFALVFKLTLFYLLNESKITAYPAFFGEFSGDSNGYLEPIDKFWNTGVLFFPHRMPGYSFVYLFFSFFFDNVSSLNLMVLFQISMASISCLLMAHLAFLLTQRKLIFFITIIFAVCSTYLSWYDWYILTESLSTSVLIILVYVLIRFSLEGKKLFWMLLPGFLFAWLIFLRPVFFPLCFVVFLLFLWKNENWKSSLLQILGFILPFLIVESIWIAANYQWHHKFIPFQESFLGPTQSNVFYEPAFLFIQSWGGNYLWWEPGAHIRYFGVGTDSISYYDKATIRFPELIFTSQFNQDSLESMSEKLEELKKNKIEWNSSYYEQRSSEVYNSFEKYVNSIRKEKPFLYHFQARISLVYQFFFTSKVRNPFYNFNFPNIESLILLKSYSYILTLFFGYLSSFILFFFVKKQPFYLLISGIVWYTFLIHPIILRVIENRYLLPSYPFLILAIVFASFEILKSRQIEK